MLTCNFFSYFLRVFNEACLIIDWFLNKTTIYIKIVILFLDSETVFIIHCVRPSVGRSVANAIAFWALTIICLFIFTFRLLHKKCGLWTDKLYKANRKFLGICFQDIFRIFCLLTISVPFVVYNPSLFDSFMFASVPVCLSVLFCRKLFIFIAVYGQFVLVFYWPLCAQVCDNFFLSLLYLWFTIFDAISFKTGKIWV